MYCFHLYCASCAGLCLCFVWFLRFILVFGCVLLTLCLVWLCEFAVSLTYFFALSSVYCSPVWLCFLAVFLSYIALCD